MGKLPNIDEALFDYLFMGDPVVRVKSPKITPWKPPSVSDILVIFHPGGQYAVLCVSLMMVVNLLYKLVLSDNDWLSRLKVKVGNAKEKIDWFCQPAVGRVDGKGEPGQTNRQQGCRERSSRLPTPRRKRENGAARRKHHFKTSAQKKEKKERKSKPSLAAIAEVTKTVSNTEINLVRAAETLTRLNKPASVIRQETFVKVSGPQVGQYIHDMHDTGSHDRLLGNIGLTYQSTMDKGPSTTEPPPQKRFPRYDMDLSHVVIDKFCDIFCLEAAEIQDRLSFSQQELTTTDSGINAALGRCFSVETLSRHMAEAPRCNGQALPKIKMYRKHKRSMDHDRHYVERASHPAAISGPPDAEILPRNMKESAYRSLSSKSRSTITVDEAVTDLMSGDFSVICSKYSARKAQAEILPCACDDQTLSYATGTDGNITKHSCNDGEIPTPFPDFRASISLSLDSVGVKRSQKHMDVQPSAFHSHCQLVGQGAAANLYPSFTESELEIARQSRLNDKMKLKHVLRNVVQTLTSSGVKLPGDDAHGQYRSSAKRTSGLTRSLNDKKCNLARPTGNAPFVENKGPYVENTPVHSNYCLEDVLEKLLQTVGNSQYVTPEAEELYVTKDVQTGDRHGRLKSLANSKTKAQTKSPATCPMKSLSPAPSVYSCQGIQISSETRDGSKADTEKSRNRKKKTLAHLTDDSCAIKDLLSKDLHYARLDMKNTERKLRYYRKHLRQPLSKPRTGVCSEKTPDIHEIKKRCMKYNKSGRDTIVARSIATLESDPTQVSGLQQTSQSSPPLVQEQKTQGRSTMKRWSRHSRLHEKSIQTRDLSQGLKTSNVWLTDTSLRKSKRPEKDKFSELEKDKFSELEKDKFSELEKTSKKSAGCQTGPGANLLHKKLRRVSGNKAVPCKEAKAEPLRSCWVSQRQDSVSKKGDQSQTKLKSPSHFSELKQKQSSKEVQVSPPKFESKSSEIKNIRPNLDLPVNESRPPPFGEESAYNSLLQRPEQNDPHADMCRGDADSQHCEDELVHDELGQPEPAAATQAGPGERENSQVPPLPNTNKWLKLPATGQNMSEVNVRKPRFKVSGLHKNVKAGRVSVATSTATVQPSSAWSRQHHPAVQTQTRAGGSSTVSQICQTSPFHRVSFGKNDNFSTKDGRRVTNAETTCPSSSVGQHDRRYDKVDTKVSSGNQLNVKEPVQGFMTRPKLPVKSKIPRPVTKAMEGASKTSASTSTVAHMLTKPTAPSRKPHSACARSTSPGSHKTRYKSTTDEDKSSISKTRVRPITRRPNTTMTPFQNQRPSSPRQWKTAGVQAAAAERVSVLCDILISETDTVAGVAPFLLPSPASPNSLTKASPCPKSYPAPAHKYSGVQSPPEAVGNKTTSKDLGAPKKSMGTFEKTKMTSSPPKSRDRKGGKRSKRHLLPSRNRVRQASACSSCSSPQHKISRTDQMPDVSALQMVQFLQLLKTIKHGSPSANDGDRGQWPQDFNTPDMRSLSSCVTFSPSPLYRAMTGRPGFPHQIQQFLEQQPKQKAAGNDYPKQVSPPINSILSPPGKRKRASRSPVPASPGRRLTEKKTSPPYQARGDTCSPKTTLSGPNENRDLKGDLPVQESGTLGDSNTLKDVDSAGTSTHKLIPHQELTGRSKTRVCHSQKGQASRKDSKSMSKSDSGKKRTKREELDALLSRAKQGKRSRKSEVFRRGKQRRGKVRSPTRLTGAVTQIPKKNARGESDGQGKGMTEPEQETCLSGRQKTNQTTGNKAMHRNFADNASQWNSTINSQVKVTPSKIYKRLQSDQDTTTEAHEHRQTALSGSTGGQRSQSPPSPDIPNGLALPITSRDGDHSVRNRGLAVNRRADKYAINKGAIRRIAYKAKIPDFHLSEPKELDKNREHLEYKSLTRQVSSRTPRKDDARKRDLLADHKISSLSKGPIRGVSQEQTKREPWPEPSHARTSDQTPPTADPDKERTNQSHNSPVTGHGFPSGLNVPTQAFTTYLKKKLVKIPVPGTMPSTHGLASPCSSAIDSCSKAPHPLKSRKIKQLKVFSPMCSPESSPRAVIVDISPLWGADKTSQSYIHWHDNERRKIKKTLKSKSDSISPSAKRSDQPEKQHASFVNGKNSSKISRFVEAMIKLRNTNSLEPGRHLEFSDVPVRLSDLNASPYHWRMSATKGRAHASVGDVPSKTDLESPARRSVVAKTSPRAGKSITLAGQTYGGNQHLSHTHRARLSKNTSSGRKNTDRQFKDSQVRPTKSCLESPSHLQNETNENLAADTVNYQMSYASNAGSKEVGHRPLVSGKVDTITLRTRTVEVDNAEESPLLLPDRLPRKIGDSSDDSHNRSTPPLSDRHSSPSLICWSDKRARSGGHELQRRASAYSGNDLQVDQLREKYLLELRSRAKRHSQESVCQDNSLSLRSVAQKNSLNQSTFDEQVKDSLTLSSTRQSEALKSSQLAAAKGVDTQPPLIKSLFSNFRLDVRQKHRASVRANPFSQVRVRAYSKDFEKCQSKAEAKDAGPFSSHMLIDGASGSWQNRPGKESNWTKKTLDSSATPKNSYPSTSNERVQRSSTTDRKPEPDMKTPSVVEDHPEPTGSQFSPAHHSISAGAVGPASRAREHPLSSSSYIRRTNTTYTIVRNQSKSSMAGARENSLWSCCWDEPASIQHTEAKGTKDNSGDESTVQKAESLRLKRPSKSRVSEVSFQEKPSNSSKDKTTFMMNKESNNGIESGQFPNPNARSLTSDRKSGEGTEGDDKEDRQSITSSAEVVISWVGHSNTQSSETMMDSSIPVFTHSARNGQGNSGAQHQERQPKASSTDHPLTSGLDMARANDHSEANTAEASDKHELSQDGTSRGQPSEMAGFDYRRKFPARTRMRKQAECRSHDQTWRRTKLVFKSGKEKSTTSVKGASTFQGNRTDTFGLLTFRDKQLKFGGTSPQREGLQLPGSAARGRGMMEARDKGSISPSNDMETLKRSEESKSGLAQIRRRVGESRKYVTSALLYTKKKKDKSSPLGNQSHSSQTPNMSADRALGFNNSASRKTCVHSTGPACPGQTDVDATVADGDVEGREITPTTMCPNSRVPTAERRDGHTDPADDEAGSKEDAEHGLVYGQADPQDNGASGAACAMASTSSKVYCDWYRPSATSLGSLACAHNPSAGHPQTHGSTDQGRHGNLYTVAVSQPFSATSGAPSVALTSHLATLWSHTNGAPGGDHFHLQRGAPHSRERTTTGYANHLWYHVPDSWAARLPSSGDGRTAEHQNNSPNSVVQGQFGATSQHSHYAPLPTAGLTVNVSNFNTRPLAPAPNDWAVPRDETTDYQAPRHRRRETVSAPQDISVSNLNSLYQTLRHNYNRMNEVFHSNWIVANQSSSQRSDGTATNPFSWTRPVIQHIRVPVNNQLQGRPWTHLSSQQNQIPVNNPFSWTQPSPQRSQIPVNNPFSWTQPSTQRSQIPVNNPFSWTQPSTQQSLVSANDQVQDRPGFSMGCGPISAADQPSPHQTTVPDARSVTATVGLPSPRDQEPLGRRLAANANSNRFTEQTFTPGNVSPIPGWRGQTNKERKWTE